MTEEQTSPDNPVITAPKSSTDNRSHVATVWRNQNGNRLLIVMDAPAKSFNIARPLVLEAIDATLEKNPAPDTATLRNALEAAHNQLSTVGKEQDMDLGCSCAIVLIKPDAVCIAHTGDIRIYRILSGHTLARLTRELTVPWARTNPGMGQVGFLGQEGELKAISPRMPIPLTPDDLVFVCTREVWRHIPEDDLLQHITDLPLAEAAEELIKLTRQSGVRLNKTCIRSRYYRFIFKMSPSLPQMGFSAKNNKQQQQ